MEKFFWSPKRKLPLVAWFRKSSSWIESGNRIDFQISSEFENLLVPMYCWSSFIKNFWHERSSLCLKKCWFKKNKFVTILKLQLFGCPPDSETIHEIGRSLVRCELDGPKIIAKIVALNDLDWLKLDFKFHSLESKIQEIPKFNLPG